MTSWTTPDGREQLYLSEQAVLDGSAAIRGGIPVIFPQFAGEGTLPKHGLARTAGWRLVPREVADAATLELTDSPETRAVWPHEFLARLTVALRPRSLEVTLAVTNRGADALDFAAALHTYLAMDDAFGAGITGLDGLRYRDSITRAPGIQHERVLQVRGAVNRVYAGVPSRIEVKINGDGAEIAAPGLAPPSRLVNASRSRDMAVAGRA